LKVPPVAVFGVLVPALPMLLDLLDVKKYTSSLYACWCREPKPVRA